uniref:DUF4283 domain-containing protein n=1 Tax=Nelumbo nucifera TaxID=4432 RepID=A0A822ZJU7_NELNU|nr:TPA_asm: hypothetical protein HUJ06_016321 [Nelumbo nucifera]
MAAAVGPRQGPSSSVVKPRSYASVVAETCALEQIHIGVKPPSFTQYGEPAVFFSDIEIEKACEPFRISLIAKCSYGRPSIPEIKSLLLAHFVLQKEVVIFVIDFTHFLFRFQCKEDFLKVWLREVIYLKGFLFQFFKWSSFFNPDEDPTVLPILINLPELPIYLFGEDFIKSIAGNIGKEMKLAIKDALQEVFGTPTDAKNAEINVHDDLEIMGDRVIESHQEKPRSANGDTINKNSINLIRVDATDLRRFHSNLATKVTEVVQRVYETVQSDDEGSQLDSSSVSEELQQFFVADTPIFHKPSQSVVEQTFVEVKPKRVRKPVKAMDEWPQSLPCF